MTDQVDGYTQVDNQNELDEELLHVNLDNIYM